MMIGTLCADIETDLALLYIYFPKACLIDGRCLLLCRMCGLGCGGDPTLPASPDRLE